MLRGMLRSRKKTLVGEVKALLPLRGALRALSWRTLMKCPAPKRSAERPTAMRLPSVAVLAGALLSVSSPVEANDIYVYPARGQSQAQQQRDRSECSSWAFQQTGGPQGSAPASTASAPYQPTQRHVVRGAARGAALGAVGGAITGDAGTGAAAGAAMGGLAGGFRRRNERRQQYAQQQAAAQATQQNRSNAYYRAMAACLQGRGYTVN